MASALKFAEAVTPALEIVLDEEQEPQIREWAAIVLRKLGTRADVSQLDGPIAMARRKTYAGRSLKSQVILTLLVHGVWTVRQAFRFAPQENPDVTDTTSFLIYEMEKRVTADDARDFISAYVAKKRRQKWRSRDETLEPSYRRKNLFVACIKRLINEPDLSSADQRMLAQLSILVFTDPDEIDLSDLILHRLSRDAYGRATCTNLLCRA